MNKKILFVSKYPDIVQEFLIAMDGKEIDIDVASNGIEAATFLKKNRYHVVITGISLDGYNGEQIIGFVNKYFPNTVCILYTTSISPAQLHFFINERNVFRVFLRPVDFHQEFYTALEDAFEYYDVRVADQEDEEKRVAEIERKEKEIPLLQEKIKKQNRSLGLNYMKRLTALTLQEYSDKLETEEKKKLRDLEWQAIDVCFGVAEPDDEQLTEAERTMRKVRAAVANK